MMEDRNEEKMILLLISAIVLNGRFSAGIFLDPEHAADSSVEYAKSLLACVDKEFE
jgi:hypothetical protein